LKKTRVGTIRLKDIKHVENSRMRGQDDVADLMQDIEQRGLLENIGIRTKDNALIFGNRRVTAFEKLGYSEIPCDYYDDVSDEELLITNLAENMKRKNIGTIEIGRICKILMDKGMTKSEIAVKLGVDKNRVDSTIKSYNIVIGTPFEKLIVYKELGRSRKGIPEKLLWSLHSALYRRRPTKRDWDILLSAAEQGKITMAHVSQIRNILSIDQQMDMNKVLDILDKAKVVHTIFHFNHQEFYRAMKKEKIESEKEFLRFIIAKYNKDLLF